MQGNSSQQSQIKFIQVKIELYCVRTVSAEYIRCAPQKRTKNVYMVYVSWWTWESLSCLQRIERNRGNKITMAHYDVIRIIFIFNEFAFNRSIFHVKIVCVLTLYWIDHFPKTNNILKATDKMMEAQNWKQTNHLQYNNQSILNINKFLFYLSRYALPVNFCLFLCRQAIFLWYSAFLMYF